MCLPFQLLALKVLIVFISLMKELRLKRWSKIAPSHKGKALQSPNPSLWFKCLAQSPSPCNFQLTIHLTDRGWAPTPYCRLSEGIWLHFMIRNKSTKNRCCFHWHRFTEWCPLPPSTVRGSRVPMVPRVVSVVLQSLSRVRLFPTPWAAALQAPLSMGFSQARILKCVAISFSRGSSWPRDRTRISCIVIFPATREALCWKLA